MYCMLVREIQANYRIHRVAGSSADNVPNFLVTRKSVST